MSNVKAVQATIKNSSVRYNDLANALRLMSLNIGTDKLDNVAKCSAIEAIADAIDTESDYIYSASAQLDEDEPNNILDTTPDAYVTIDFNSLTRANPRIKELLTLVVSTNCDGIQYAIDAITDYREAKRQLMVEMSKAA